MKEQLPIEAALDCGYARFYFVHGFSHMTMNEQDEYIRENDLGNLMRIASAATRDAEDYPVTVKFNPTYAIELALLTAAIDMRLEELGYVTDEQKVEYALSIMTENERAIVKQSGLLNMHKSNLN